MFEERFRQEQTTSDAEIRKRILDRYWAEEERRDPDVPTVFF